jgi:hypothetical protein
MNIGDVFFALRGDGSGLAVDAKKAAEAAGATGATSFSASFNAKLKGLGAAGGVAGFGVAAGMAAWNALGASVHGAIQFMDDAVHAAMEDEASQVKLQAALTANVKGWDGNTAAIEKVIKSRMNLGFSDEDQRASLAVLVAKTGDVTSALQIQGAAMDLARLKGIDLAAASKAIALGMGGQGRALKELGINVKDYANANEILAAIQAKASGQAEAYANTTAGAMEAAKVQIDEATEAIGYALLPKVKELALFTRDNAVPAVNLLMDALAQVGQGLSNIQRVRDVEVDAMAKFIGPMPGPFHKELASVKEFTAAEILAGWAALDARDKIEGAMGATVTLGSAASKAGSKVDAFAGSADRAKSAFELMGDKFKTTWSELSAAAQGAADDIFGPQTRAAAKAANEREIATEQAIIAARNLTAGEKRQLDIQIINQEAHLAKLKKNKASANTIAAAQEKLDVLRQKANLADVTTAEKQAAADRLIALQKEGLGIRIEMAGRGELTKAAYDTLISELQTQAKNGNLEIASSAQVALDNLARLRTAIYTLPAVTTTGQRAVGGSPGRAAGGPVTAGVLYRVNENHTEYFRSSTDGMVVPLAPAGASVPQVAQGAGRGGFSPTYNVNVTGLLRAETPDDIGRVLRRTAALGMTHR